MKIAICMSGYLRTYEQTYKSLFDNIDSGFDCDFFFHIWRERERERERVEEIYKPKKIVVEDYYDAKFEHIQKQIKIPIVSRKSVHGFASMFYSIQQCNNLKNQYAIENNIKYEYTIRCRPDLFFYDKITKAHLPKTNEINAGFQPYKHLIVKHPQPTIDKNTFTKCTRTINDQFAIGNDYSMDAYCNTYDNLINLSKEFTEFRPENILITQLKQLQIIMNPLPIYYGMLRSDGNICILQ